MLVVGGNVTDGNYERVDLYDPAGGTWTTTGSLNQGRSEHTATLLQDGKVLVAGGYVGYVGPSLATPTAEVYDPALGVWTNTASLNVSRYEQTATMLTNGKVLVVGGYPGTTFIPLNSAELYDPASGSWTNTGALNVARVFHTATLLGNGEILVSGGFGSQGYLASAELYNPAAGTWTLISNAMTTARGYHTATLLPDGKVLVAGGFNGSYLSSAELYDPIAGAWTATSNAMTSSRGYFSATLLPNGLVLAAGGITDTNIQAGADLFNPVSCTWTNAGMLNMARARHTATLLPNGEVLIAGGDGPTFALSVSPTTELYAAAPSPGLGTWTNTGFLNVARFEATQTLLPGGKVLLAGGYSTQGPTNAAELYDPGAGKWSLTGSLATARGNHTATLLPDGNVLVAGGVTTSPFSSSVLTSTELYRSASGQWIEAQSMNQPRAYHTATLLLNGKVLVSGGGNASGNSSFSSAEIYDPTDDTWTVTGSLANARANHTATLLPSGKVLVAGGTSNGVILSSAELYDPATGQWLPTAPMNRGRSYQTATLLASGKVLVAEGLTDDRVASAELYDPVAGTWSMTGDLPDPLAFALHTATLLPNGKVLIVGGYDFVEFATCELYDPITNGWTYTGSLPTGQFYHAATLLLDGRVLIAGGAHTTSASYSSEIYDVGLGFSNSWRPQVGTVTSPLNLGGCLTVGGSGFRGISGGSGGNTQDSPGDYPLAQLRSLESGQTAFLISTNWSANSFVSGPVWRFPPGSAALTVFVNGIPSLSSVINIGVPVPFPAALNAQRVPDGSFQLSLTNSIGATFGLFATTDLALPLTNWTPLGSFTEVSPGFFQFTDSQTGNNPQRFYIARAP